MQLALWWDSSELEVRNRRKKLGIVATFKQVDTCAAEFEAYTPYYYSTYEDEDETPARKPAEAGGLRIEDIPGAAARLSNRDPQVSSLKPRIMILGGGPNRIGQGIEFDYCCCHASFALRELGVESIMVNSNPETVSLGKWAPDGLLAALAGGTPPAWLEPLAGTQEQAVEIYRLRAP